MRYANIKSVLFKRNRSKLADLLNDNSVAIIHSNFEVPRNGDQYYPYRQNSDFFYLTGIEQEKSILVLCPNHKNEKLREVLFVLKPNKTMEIWNGHKLTIDEAQEISDIKTVYYLEEYDSYINNLAQSYESIFVNLPENMQVWKDLESRDYSQYKQTYKKFPLHKYNRLAPLLTQIRLIKEPEEIEIMEIACAITNKAFSAVLKNTKPKMKEFEVEALITYEFIKNGANGHAYAPIVASGKNACVLHYIDNDNLCNNGDLLLMDFGAEYANYAADCTRTIPVNGKFSPRQKDCYQSVLNVLKIAQKLLVPGTTINEVNKKVNILMEEEMIKLGLFSEDDVKSQDSKNPMYFKYFMHGTSHFIGLDVHDVGAKDVPLKKGMVLSCEPGIYIAEEGIGIRLENDIMVDENPVNLLADIPIEIEEIERLMQNK